MTHKLYLFIAATVLLNLSNAARVSETVCTKDTGTQCTAIDHAECDNAVSDTKCQCSNGHKEDSGDGSTCVKARVSETVCTKDTGTECTAIDHAECDNAVSDTKCKCSNGHKEDSDDGSTCVKVRVSETVCTKDTGTECTAIDNAECDNAVSDTKCKCSNGYKEDSDDGSTCVKVKVSETVCTKDTGTECAAIEHAECDDADTDAKCKCSDGYKEGSGDGSTCVKGAAGNSAPSVVQAAGIIFMSLVVTVFQKLLNA